MTCDSVSKLIPLYYYGELMPEDEDRVEAHLHECGACAREMDRQRSMAVALDHRHAEYPAVLLDDCRADLMAAIHGGAPRSGKPGKSAWTLFLDAMAESLAGLGRFRQPVAAAALIAVGFVVAKYTPGGLPFANRGYSAASMAPEDVFATIRSVQPDSAGHVQISYDETRRRVISGNTDDLNIRKLLLAAAHEQNPEVRAESVDFLKSRAASIDVRDSLLNELAYDSNARVRLKALEALKPLAADPDVRKTLAQVLLTDDNQKIRMQVVDLLVAHRDDSMVGMLQNVMQREDNNYVRLKCEKALKELNASVGTF
jgi:anti-sigma factor RsiW